MANLALMVPVLLLAVFVQNGESVRCWECSSFLDHNCNDPFTPDVNNYNYSLVDCDSIYRGDPDLTFTKSSCRKRWRTVVGELVVNRGCEWKRSDDYSNLCPNSSTARNTVIHFCETCDYDGCNGTSTIGKVLALLLAPLALLFYK